MAKHTPRESTPVFFETPAEFRDWLRANHKTAPEILVGYYKKATGLPSVTWEETVDEALCYGWIDGVRRSLDARAYVIRFTPRKPKSVWSRRNIERVEALKAARRMRKAGLDAYAHKDVHPESGYAASVDDHPLSEDMIAEFKKHANAWAFYESQPAGYKRQSAAWVTSAKREETRARRFAMLVADSKAGLRVKPFRRA